MLASRLLSRKTASLSYPLETRSGVTAEIVIAIADRDDDDSGEIKIGDDVERAIVQEWRR